MQEEEKDPAKPPRGTRSGGGGVESGEECTANRHDRKHSDRRSPILDTPSPSVSLSAKGHRRPSSERRRRRCQTRCDMTGRSTVRDYIPRVKKVLHNCPPSSLAEKVAKSLSTLAISSICVPIRTVRRVHPFCYGGVGYTVPASTFCSYPAPTQASMRVCTHLWLVLSHLFTSKQAILTRFFFRPGQCLLERSIGLLPPL